MQTILSLFILLLVKYGFEFIFWLFFKKVFDKNLFSKQIKFKKDEYTQILKLHT